MRHRSLAKSLIPQSQSYLAYQLWKYFLYPLVFFLFTSWWAESLDSGALRSQRTSERVKRPMTSLLILSPLTYSVPVCVSLKSPPPPHLTLAFLPHKARSSPSSCSRCVSHPFPNSPPQQQIRHSLQTRALHAYPHSVSVTLIRLLTWHWIMVTIRLPFSIIKKKHTHIMEKKKKERKPI